MLEWQEQYLMSERSEQVRYSSSLPREHVFCMIHNFELACSVLLLYRHTDDGVLDDFPKISDDLQKISENYLKLVGRSHVI